MEKVIVIQDKENKKNKNKEKTFEEELGTMEQYFLNKSIGLDLKEIIKYIGIDKDYIFNFIRHPEVEKLSKDIVKMYKFNKDEAEDIVPFAIIEFFYQNDIDLENFNDADFLYRLYKFIKLTVKEHIRQGYSAKECPSSNWSEYIDRVNDKFDEDKIIEYADLKNAINTLSKRDQEIFQLYYIDNNTLQQIADMLSLSKTYVHTILFRSKNKIKNILKF